MKYTSAEAAKLLKRLSDELTALSSFEDRSSEFVAAVGEDAAKVKPEYDFSATQAKLLELEGKIRSVKHALNIFNTTTVVPGFDMTIDQILVLIPQLTAKKRKLAYMKNKLPITREPSSSRTGLIEYRYLNYNLADAEKQYAAIDEMLSKAQTALDLINSTATLEIDL